jgi:hypothetical protein
VLTLFRVSTLGPCEETFNLRFIELTCRVHALESEKSVYKLAPRWCVWVSIVSLMKLYY